MVQIITGHNFFARHNALVNKTTGTGEEMCEYCGEEEETTFHLVAECHCFIKPRYLIFKSKDLKPPFKFSAVNLLRFLREAKMESTLSYLT